MRLALFQPEIPQNTGTLVRLAACLGFSIDIIHPCGYVWNDKKLKRAGMDYIDNADIHHHDSFHAFLDYASHARIILVDVRGEENFSTFHFKNTDIILMGRESDGVPDTVFEQIAHRVHIPMKHGRSLNVAVAATLVIGKIIKF